MKQIFIFTAFALLLLGACSLDTTRGTIVINFCDMISTYANCTAIELSQTDIEMTLLTQPDVTVDSVIFELPNPDDAGDIVYCSTSGTLTADGNEYFITVPCDLSEYERQNTQLNFVVTMTVPDTTAPITVEGQAEDYVED